MDGIANPLTCPESLIFNPKNVSFSKHRQKYPIYGKRGYIKLINTIFTIGSMWLFWSSKSGRLFFLGVFPVYLSRRPKQCACSSQIRGSNRFFYSFNMMKYFLSSTYIYIYMFNFCNIVFTDCQYFFLCLNGKDARRNGCQVNYSLPVTLKLK